MRNPKFYSVLFGLLGTLLIAGAVALSFPGRSVPAVLLVPSEEAQQLTVDFMDSVSAGDFEDAASMLLGCPQLDSEADPEPGVSSLLWEAFTGSIFYEFPGDLYATGTGCCRDVTVTALNTSRVLDRLEQTIASELAQQAAITDQNAVFDESGNYRESFVMDVLQDTAAALLSEGDLSTTQTITLELRFQEGRWWILPRQELLDLFCGKLGS